VARNDGPSHSLKRQPDPRFGESASTRLRKPAGNQCSGAPGREPRRPEVEFDGVLSGPPSRLPGAGCCRAGRRPLRERGRRPGGRPEDAPGANAAGRGLARWPGRWWRPGLAKAAGRAGTGCRGGAGPGAARAAGARTARRSRPRSARRTPRPATADRRRSGPRTPRLPRGWIGSCRSLSREPLR
jgi:hypothetical protein